MSKIANPEQYAQSTESKGDLKYRERSRWLLFGLPWTFTKYEIRENDFTIIKGFFTVRENDCRPFYSLFFLSFLVDYQ